MRVAEDQRAGTADVIDVLVAVDVPQAGALAVRVNQANIVGQRIAAEAPEGFLTADDVIVMNSVSVDGGAQPLV
jgi:hypothetical protein